MRFTAATTAALAAGASAQYYSPAKNATYVTTVVSSYVTYCPSATQLTYGGQTYTVTKPTTLTITNCPCTVTKPVTTSTLPCTTSTTPKVQTVYTTSCPSASSTSVYTAPVYTSTAVYSPPKYQNATTTVVKPVGTGAYTAPVASYTGAANKAFSASGAGLAAVLGLAAYVL